MFGKEGTCEVNQVVDSLVVAVRPERRELKRVARLLALIFSSLLLFDMVEAGGVRVIFGIGAVGNDENLNIFIQPAACPKTIPLIAVNLVERLFELNASSLQLYMHKRQTIDENGNIIASIVISLFLFILVNDLEVVVMNILLVNQVDILCFASVSFEDLDMVFLYLGSLSSMPSFWLAITSLKKRFHSLSVKV